MLGGNLTALIVISALPVSAATPAAASGTGTVNFTPTGFGTFHVTTPCGAGSFAFELEAQQPSLTSNLTGNWRSIEQSQNTVSIHTVDQFTTAQGSGVFTYSGAYGC